MDKPEDHPVESISALLDNELGPAERESVERHLQACAGCRRLLEEMRALAGASLNEEIPPSPGDLARRIAARLPEPAGRTATPFRLLVPRRAFRFSPLQIAAAASVVLALGLAIFGERAFNTGARRSEPAVEARPDREEKPAGDVVLKGAAREAGPPPEAAAGPEARSTPRTKDQPAAPALRPQARAFAPVPPAAGEGAPPPAAARPIAAVPDTAEGGASSGARMQATPAQDLAKRAGVPEPERVMAGEPAPGRAPRRLVLQAPGREIELDETGTLRVRGAGYACTVAIPSGIEARRDRAGEAGAGPASAGGAAADDPLATRRLFALASSAAFLAAPPGEGPAAAGGRRRVVLLDGAGAPIHAADCDTALPEGASAPADLAARLERLARERYREALEGACGPLPGELAPAR